MRSHPRISALRRSSANIAARKSGDDGARLRRRALQGQPYVKIAAALCLLACLASASFAQDEDQLTAKTRVLPTFGPGLRSSRGGANGDTYGLSAPARYLSVFGKDGKLIK